MKGRVGGHVGGHVGGAPGLSWNGLPARYEFGNHSAGLIGRDAAALADRTLGRLAAPVCCAAVRLGPRWMLF
jgi:hypothetical protein